MIEAIPQSRSPLSRGRYLCQTDEKKKKKNQTAELLILKYFILSIERTDLEFLNHIYRWHSVKAEQFCTQGQICNSQFLHWTWQCRFSLWASFLEIWWKISTCCSFPHTSYLFFKGTYCGFFSFSAFPSVCFDNIPSVFTSAQPFTILNSRVIVQYTH